MKLISILEISLVVGLVGGVPVALVIMILRGLFFLPFIVRKRRKEAETVIAELDYSSVRHDTDPRGQTSAYYDYTVDGKTYRYWALVGRLDLKDKITLYYMPGDEAHAKTMQEFTGDKHVFIECYPIAVIICTVIFAVFAMLLTM